MEEITPIFVRQIAFPRIFIYVLLELAMYNIENENRLVINTFLKSSIDPRSYGIPIWYKSDKY